MTLFDLLEFCKEKNVEVSIRFERLTELVILKLRRGNTRVYYSIEHPDQFSNIEYWEDLTRDILDVMVLEINNSALDTTQK